MVYFRANPCPWRFRVLRVWPAASHLLSRALKDPAQLSVFLTHRRSPYISVCVYVMRYDRQSTVSPYDLLLDDAQKGVFFRIEIIQDPCCMLDTTWEQLLECTDLKKAKKKSRNIYVCLPSVSLSVVQFLLLAKSSSVSYCIDVK